MEEGIKDLIRIYQASATNLRKVADLAAAQNPEEDSVVAQTSRAKANTYDLVITDLENLLILRKEQS